MMSYYKKRNQSPSRESVARLFDQTMAALGNRNMQIKAAAHVGGRTEFLGAGSYIDPRDRAELRSRGTQADNQFFTAYGTGGATNESIKRGPAAVPKDLFPTVTAPPPVTSIAPPTKPSSTIAYAHQHEQQQGEKPVLPPNAQTLPEFDASMMISQAKIRTLGIMV